MPTYLFVTKPEHTPERVELGENLWWSCSSTTQSGDYALLYVTGMGIRYEWQALSDAKPDDKWKYVCEVGYLRTFDPHITFREIYDAVLEHKWAPVLQNFRGLRSIIVPEEVAGKIKALRYGGEPHIFPDEVDDKKVFREGAVRQVSVNAYERNPQAREACIAHYGTRCYVCHIDFGELYGPAVKGFIHVHHLCPLSSTGEGYKVDPSVDLRPVCPNCHAVIHSRTPPYSMEEVRQMMITDK